jgi:hypothetical protein
MSASQALKHLLGRPVVIMRIWHFGHCGRAGAVGSRSSMSVMPTFTPDEAKVSGFGFYAQILLGCLLLLIGFLKKQSRKLLD